MRAARLGPNEIVTTCSRSGGGKDRDYTTLQARLLEMEVINGEEAAPHAIFLVIRFAIIGQHKQSRGISAHATLLLLGHGVHLVSYVLAVVSGSWLTA